MLPSTPNYLESTALCDVAIGNAEQSTTWKELIGAFRSTTSTLRRKRTLKDIKYRNIMTVIRTYYIGIVWPQISLDLVAAALRQREFARKITAEDCATLDSPHGLTNAISRYHKFLLLLKRKYLFKKTHLVPTLDIDLSWHTHQLFPISYSEWCAEYVGHGVNHDDTLPHGDLQAGLRATSIAWSETYKEPYTTDDLKGKYFSTGRKVLGLIMPVYGLHMLHKGHQLEKAQSGNLHNNLI
jgi:hypothetical protein